MGSSPTHFVAPSNGRQPIVARRCYLVMPADPLDHMRRRALQCRRLADSVSDQRASEELHKMAEEIEADIVRLEAECAARTG